MDTTKIDLPEAPSVLNVNFTSAQGFDCIYTIRGLEGKETLGHLRIIEKTLTDLGCKPQEKRSWGPKKEAKPVEYVEGQMCPKCKNQLVYATTKAGKKIIKCSTAKWDGTKNTGCDYVDWNNS